MTLSAEMTIALNDIEFLGAGEGEEEIGEHEVPVGFLFASGANI